MAEKQNEAQSQKTEEQEDKSQSQDEGSPNQETGGDPSPSSEEDKVDSSYMKTLLAEIEEEIRQERKQEEESRLRKDKDIVKEIYKKMEGEMGTYKSENEELKSKIAELEQRLGKISSGSKTNEQDANPLREEAKPDTSKDRSEIAKEALRRMGIRVH